MVSILLKRLQATVYKTSDMTKPTRNIPMSINTCRNLITFRNFGTWRFPLQNSAVDHEATIELAKKKGVIPDENVQAALEDPMATWEEAKAQPRQKHVKANDHEGPAYVKEQDEQVQERTRKAEATD